MPLKAGIPRWDFLDVPAPFLPPKHPAVLQMGKEIHSNIAAVSKISAAEKHETLPMKNENFSVSLSLSLVDMCQQ